MTKKLFICITAVIVAAVSLQSCQKEMDIPMQETAGSLLIPSSAGTKDITIEAVGDWTATIKGAEEHWATIDQKNGNGNSTLKLTYRANDSFSRMCRVVIEQLSSSKVDTIFVKQYGKTSRIEFGKKAVGFPVVNDEATVPFNTNFTNAWLSEADINVKYEGKSTGWITTEIDYETTSLKIKNTINDQTEERKAKIIFSYTDGWEEKHEITLPVTQIGNRAANGKLISMSDLKKMISGAEGKITIPEDVIMEGIVINSHNNPNSAMNPNLSWDSIDSDMNYKTAYLQTEDASEGISLVFNTKEDNICTSRSKIKVSLRDATLEKLANPERYIISDIESTYLTALDTGAVNVLPEKVRSFAELTDKDVFTYVTLKNCEIGVNEGSYTAVNEGYGSAYNAFRFDTWPLLIRDIDGNDMYMMTNIDCPYRRTGAGLPLGSGRISGVIVHDIYQRFEKDGNIGRYQIRHLDLKDIDLEKKQENGFSNILVQWATKIGHDLKIDGKWTLKPTIGEGIFKHSTGSWLSGDHSYMQPGTDNKGVCTNVAWAQTNWGKAEPFNYWVMIFSTTDINSNVISLQINTLAKTGGPRYWAVETSTDKGNTWKRCAEYTVPDLVAWSNTLLTQIPGGKSMNFTLPAEICGQEEVQVRLIPTKNSAGTTTEYDGADNTNRNVITYAAIRYNK